jgi:glycosyltransferase involved in cell wall biosynthesis
MYSRKKIMHMMATNFFGGPEKQIVEHLLRLDSKRFIGQITSFLENDNQNELLNRAGSLGLSNFGIRMSSAFDVRALLNVVRLVKSQRVNLLCVHGYKSTIMGCIAAKLNGIPIIGFSRGYTAEDKKVAFYEWLDRKCLKNVDGIVCVSRGQKKQLRALGVRSSRFWVVHNSVSLNDHVDIECEKTRRDVLERLGIPGDSMLIVTAGRLSPEKGHRYLVDAISRLNKCNGAYFVFCGSGACQAELEEKARDADVSEKCRFPGFRRDLQEIFRVMDLLVLPSLTEGLPNVVLEAFACKKPVIASAVGGVPEIVQDGINGVLVPPGDPDSLAKAISSFITSPDQFKHFGEAGYAKVRQNFTFELQTQRLESIYSELLGRS